MKVNIHPSVALQEALAEADWLRNRNLLLAQGMHELREALARLEAEAADAKAGTADQADGETA